MNRKWMQFAYCWVACNQCGLDCKYMYIYQKPVFAFHIQSGVQYLYQIAQGYWGECDAEGIICHGSYLSISSLVHKPFGYGVIYPAVEFVCMKYY